MEKLDAGSGSWLTRYGKRTQRGEWEGERGRPSQSRAERQRVARRARGCG